MRGLIQLLVGLVVGVLIGVLAGWSATGGAKTVPTQTATTTVIQTSTTTVVQSHMSSLEEALLNGTYWHRCIFCNMLINDTRFSAVVVLKSGHVVRTDDIGCIFRMALLPPDKWKALGLYPPEEVKSLVSIEKIYVPDFHNSSILVDAEKAYYVIRQDMKTPMGDCVLAFADVKNAEMYNKTVYTYSQMLDLYREVMRKTGMPRPNWCKGAMHMQH